ncbi:PTS sugar transporter subunit IIBC [Erysipelothrix larvae]|uniref:PTS sugar transporter subunit IIBC n=1 Tax=Erysipelothrix larvae TaxID=1514105 RepID=A0A0X8GZ57_9FIRM|nr:beta-glucoside-specific PTS transporter subunit IIABC [Erysipelothrix larvae]AMC93113.1 PTS sugar transporter subunit IIBC [Erysipelothrix larvae]
MNYKETAKTILEQVGGKGNVAGFTNCATRLRFTLKNKENLDLNELKKIDGVIDVVKSGAQFQFIIGTDVTSVAKELHLLGLEGDGAGENDSKTTMKPIDRLFDTISGIFTPLIPALTAAGMLKAVLVLLSTFKIVASDSSSYLILSFVADAAFYFLPVFVAISTAFKLKCNPYIAGLIGASLIHPKFLAMVAEGTPVSLFGINVPLVSYASSVIPSILSVLFMSYVERFADKVSPKVIKFLLRPLLTLIIVLPFTLVVFGPLGSYVGNVLASGANFLNENIPWLVSALMGGLFPLLVLTGMHWSFVPIIVQSYATYNYEGIMGPGSFVSNICQGAASLAVGLKTKNKELKQTSISAGVTALLGITEPALFGVTLKVKKALIAVMVGGAVGGLYAGIQGVVRYTSGTPGLASFAIFIGENPMNVVHALISVGIGFVVTFVLTWFFTDPDSDMKIETQDKPTFKAIEKKEILSPLEGNVINIKDVNDPTFSNEIIGRGIAVMPTQGIAYAPFDGVVQMAFSTGHAIGLVNQDGIELLIHIGIDTVKLEGNGFKLLVKQGDTVNKGQKLVEFDIDAIKSKGFDLTSPVIVTNLHEDVELITTNQETITRDETLIVLL